MNRKDKFPETSTFIYFNANPKNRLTTDCYLRAICTALDKPYGEVLRGMVEIQIETGYDIASDKAIELYLKKKGWKKNKQPWTDEGTKYTGERFCNLLSINYPNGEFGNIIAKIGGHHIVCIKPTNSGDRINCGYKVHDTWDCTMNCIGNYYTKA